MNAPISVSSCADRWLVRVCRPNGDILEYEYRHESQARYAAAVFSLGARRVPKPTRRMRPSAWLAGLGQPPAERPPVLSRSPARRSQRFGVTLAVTFHSELEFVTEHATNISAGGMFVRTAMRPAVDSIVLISVELPTRQTLRGRARVVYVRDVPVYGGVGVEFVESDPAFRGALDAYLATLA